MNTANTLGGGKSLLATNTQTHNHVSHSKFFALVNGGLYTGEMAGSQIFRGSGGEMAKIALVIL